MTDTTESLRAVWNAWKPWAYPYSETGMCEMCSEIDGHGMVDEGDPHERPCLVGAYATALARLEAAERLRPEAKRLIQVLDNAVPNPGWRTRLLSLLVAIAREETPRE